MTSEEFRLFDQELLYPEISCLCGGAANYFREMFGRDAEPFGIEHQCALRLIMAMQQLKKSFSKHLFTTHTHTFSTFRTMIQQFGNEREKLSFDDSYA